MIRRCAFLIVGLVIITNAIDQTCSGNSCPNNSECQSSNHYCVCEEGFIGNCNVSAQELQSNSVNSNLKPNQTNLFSTQPQELNRYIQFTYTICQNNSSQLILTFTLWGETGQNTQYNSSNALTSPTQATLGTGCSTLVTPYIQFGDQPNGQDEMLILGITDNSAISARISISVSQRIIFGFLIYYYILIGLGAFVILFLLVGGAIFIVRRRRLRALAAAHGISRASGPPQANDISYFETEMPSFKGEALGSEKSMCPICLMQIEKREQARKTPCAHSFHANCIDSWCKKNLNCPVCRCELSREKINEKKQEAVTPQYHPIIEDTNEDKPDQPPIFIQQKYEIRENML